MAQPVSPDLLALQELLAGRYSIERELGRGGMGIVFLARDVALDRLVAIKLLPRAFSEQAEYRDRFLHEARTAAGLSHPNIVPIHSVEEHANLVFFVMGYVDGPTLRERVERGGPLPPRLATKLMQEVAWALAYAHQRGVIHRDVKPDNIMIELGTDRAFVTDFGIALSRRVEGRRDDGEVVGTARYMSPEQACGEPLDARSDLYALGATFFYALTGRPPVDGRSLPAIITQLISQPTPGVALVRPDVPAKLAAVVDRCLAKAPADRWPAGDDVARVLGEARGRDFRAPPLVRSFVRNAEVSTMVLLASIVAGGGVSVGSGGMHAGAGGPGLIGTILIIQLVVVARRLLREGYGFADIHDALLAEARVQDEEAEVLGQRGWMRRLNSQWQRLWAGKFGRWFFKVAGTGLEAPAGPSRPSADATEFVLGRSTLAAYAALPAALGSGAREVPALVQRLEARAERLRAAGDTGERLNDTVAALENVRLALLKLSAGVGSMEDLTLVLERAKAIGDAVDRQLEAGNEVREALRDPAGG
jgi:serine/threonine-protein kinase